MQETGRIYVYLYYPNLDSPEDIPKIAVILQFVLFEFLVFHLITNNFLVKLYKHLESVFHPLDWDSVIMLYGSHYDDLLDLFRLLFW